MRILLRESRPGMPRRALSLSLILLAATGLAVFALFGNLAGSRSASLANVSVLPPADSVAAVDAVHAFSTFAAGGRAERDAAPDHAYTSEGIRKLADALEKIVQRSPARASTDGMLAAELREQADLLQLNPRAMNHADIARGAFIAVAGTISAVQATRYPALERAAAELRDAASAIRPDRRLLSQTDAIQAFFDRASDVLRGMAEVGV